MNSLTLVTFNSLEPAEALKHRLEEAGIHAVVHDESKLQKYWFLTAPTAAQKVEVDRRDFETAKRLLAECSEHETLLKDAVRCPECGSSRIEYPQFTRKFITPTLVEIVTVLRLVPREFYCEDCHYTWPREAQKDPERDLLGWPAQGKGLGAARLPQTLDTQSTIASSQVAGWMQRIKTKFWGRKRQ